MSCLVTPGMSALIWNLSAVCTQHTTYLHTSNKTAIRWTSWSEGPAGDKTRLAAVKCWVHPVGVCALQRVLRLHKSQLIS